MNASKNTNKLVSDIFLSNGISLYDQRPLVSAIIKNNPELQKNIEIECDTTVREMFLDALAQNLGLDRWVNNGDSEETKEEFFCEFKTRAIEKGIALLQSKWGGVEI